MASIPGFQTNITGASGSQGLLSPKSGWRGYVFPRGGYAAQDSTGTRITFDSASVASRFAALNWVQVGLSTANIRQVSAVGGNSIAVNTAVTVSENQRIYLIGNTEPTVSGGSATYTTPNTLVRQRDDDTADLYTNSMITTNADGLIQGFAATGLYDVIVQDGNQANQGSLIDLIVGVPDGISVSDWAHFGSTVTLHANAGITGSLVIGGSLTVHGAIGVTGWATFGSTVTINAALGVTGTAIFGGSLSATNIGQVRYAERFSGTNLGAKVTAALADLPSSGGIVDARGLVGGETISSTLTIAAGQTVLLGYARINCSAKTTVRERGALIGSGNGTSDNTGTKLVAANSLNDDVVLCQNSAGAGDWWHGGQVENLSINGNSANQTSGSGIRVNRPGEVSIIRNISIVGCKDDGFVAVTNGANGCGFENLSVFTSGRYGFNFSNFSGVGFIKNLSGDNNTSGLLRVNGNNCMVTVAGFKAETTITGAHDPCVLIDSVGNQPTITIINGSAKGVGVALASFCSITTADARLQLIGCEITGYTNWISDGVNGVTITNSGFTKATPILYGFESSMLYVPRGIIHSSDRIQMEERSDPSAPTSNRVLIYARDTGGKTELVARFPTGAIQQIAIEP
jgi:hypothetical protein